MPDSTFRKNANVIVRTTVSYAVYLSSIWIVHVQYCMNIRWNVLCCYYQRAVSNAGSRIKVQLNFDVYLRAEILRKVKLRKMVSLLTRNNMLKMCRLFRPLFTTLNQNVTVRSSNLSLFAFGPTKPFFPAISSRYLLKDSQIPCYRKSPGVVSLQCLEDMLEEGDIQLFDVREPEELQEDGKIPGSVNLPGKERQLL